jgi:2-keto-4-pentenoate hydratase
LKENIISSDLSVHEMNEKISNVLPKIEVVNTEISKFGKQLKNLPDYFNYKKYLLTTRHKNASHHQCIGKNRQ